MCEVKIASLVKALSNSDNKKKLHDINLILNSLKKDENALNDAIVYLLTNIGSSNSKRKVYLKIFCIILESLNDASLKFTTLQMRKLLFVKKIKDATKGKMSINKLGSILSFDSLISVVEISKIDEESLIYFYEFILCQIDDHSLGFVAILAIINLYRRIDNNNFQQLIKHVKDDFFETKSVIKNPQYLLLWIAFSDDHKKILKSLTKSVPSIQSKDVLSNLVDVLKSCKEDQIKIIWNYLASNESFTVVLKSFLDSFLKELNHSKLKQILLLSFEVICPQKGGPIDRLSKEKRETLVNKVWGEEVIVNLVLKQLSDSKLDMHGLCQKFISDLAKSEISNTPVLEELFKLLLAFGKQFIILEIKINQSLRLSNVLLRHVKSIDIFRNYTKLILEQFESSERSFQKIYCMEQLSMAFVKCSSRDIYVVEKLLSFNYQYNYNEPINDIGLVEAAQSALLRCLEIMGNDDMEKLRAILTKASDIYKGGKLSDICEKVLNFWSISCPKSKKRTASQQNEISIDFTNKTTSMFIGLLVHMCIYVGSQPFDEDTIVMIEDILTCFDKCRGKCEMKTPTKRSKMEINNPEDFPIHWAIVLTEVLAVLLEQSCHYLRTLATNTFRVMVQEGICNQEIIERIETIIKKTEVETRSVHQKKSGENEDIENAEESDSDISDEGDDEDKMDIVEDEGDMKARIFSALESVNSTNINSDSDDNCPAIDESDDSSVGGEDNGNIPGSKIKITLKEKRKTVLQLSQFRNRCLDILENVFMEAPRLDDRLSAFIILLNRVGKADRDIESRLIRATKIFKKYQPEESLSVNDIIRYINKMLEGLQRCTLSKKIIHIFSSIVVTFLHMKRTELNQIVDSFKQIIEQCITDKKKNQLKAIFLETFDTMPEISWAFHEQMLPFISIEQPEHVQLQAISILRKIIANQSIKNIVNKNTDTSFVSKIEIISFAKKFGGIIQSILMSIDVISRAKYSALMIGSLVDCLKLGGHAFYETLDINILEKIKAIPKKSVPKDLEKTFNKLESAADLAKKTVIQI